MVSSLYSLVKRNSDRQSSQLENMCGTRYNWNTMCGRYYLLTNISELEERFGFDFNSERVEYVPSYNVAPTQSALAVTDEVDGRIGQMMRGELGQPAVK